MEKWVFLLLGLLSCATYANQQLDDLEVDATEVKFWALKFGKAIAEGSAEATCSRKIAQNYHDLGASVKRVDAIQIFEEMRIDVQNMMHWKTQAVKRLYEAAEAGAAQHHFEKNLNFDYFHVKKVFDIRDNNKEEDFKPLELNPHKNFDVPVNTNQSAIHVPINVYNRAPEVVNAIKWSEYLNPTFRNNLVVDPSLSYQFFGSSTGFLRIFPSMKWKVAEKPDMYDSRMRRWYIQGAASPKDLVILLDGSGSMTGLRKEIARNVVINILDTLTDNDYVTIMRFSDTITPVVECFQNSMVLANDENIRAFKENLDELDTSNIANFSLALITAFELLQTYNRTNQGSQCNQAIMLITDGAPSSYEEIFRRFNWPNIPVRVFTYLIGREVTDIQEVNEMACSNRGYYTHVTTLAEVREQVQKYIPVMSRPIVLYGIHDFFWTPVYADVSGVKLTDWIWEERERAKIRKAMIMDREKRLKEMSMLEQGDVNMTGSYELQTEPDPPRKAYKKKSIQLMTTVATPVFDKRNYSTRMAKLLGVVGTDVPIREITKLTPAFKLGVGGYSYAVNNNGYMLFHPEHRPLFQDLIKPGYSSVDLTEVEQEDNDLLPRDWGEKLDLIRTNMIKRKIGWTRMTVKVQTDNMRRIFTRDNTYYYGPLDGTPFTLGIALPEPYGHYRVVGEFEVKRRMEEWSEYFKGQNWRVHPDWVYCESPMKKGHRFQSPEDVIRDFLKEVQGEQHFKWRSPSTNPPIFEKPNCEKDLIQSLVFDAKVTDVFAKKYSPPKMTSKYEDHMIKMYGIVATFVATRTGLLRFQDHRSDDEKMNATERPFFEQHIKATEELFYKRAVDYHYHNSSSFVFSVPFDAGQREGTYVTGSHAIFIGAGKQKAPAAVVGLQFKHSLFAERFFNITSTCMQSCRYKCNDDQLDCFLLDNNGFVVVSEAHEHTGKFFGEIDSTLFLSMIKYEIYKKVTYYDYQAICQDDIIISGPGSILLTPFSMMKNMILWMWGRMLVFFVQYNLMNTWDWVLASSAEYEYDYDEDRVVLNKTKTRPCDKEIDLYEMKPLDSGEPIKGRLSTCHVSGCHKQFIVQPIPFTNLVMLAVYNTCPCEATSNPLEPRRVEHNETLACERRRNSMFRERPAGCYFYHSDEMEIKQCGRAPQLSASMSVLFLLLILWGL